MMELFNYLFLTCCSIPTILGQSNPKNVLMFVIDDLRPEFGPYLDMDDAFYPMISTPNMNALANESMVMRRAYTQYALCGPSRTSFLTGRRPDTTKIFSNGGSWRDVGGNFTSFPQYFRENGYLTYAAGKIYHGTQTDDPYSWSDEQYFPTTKPFWHEDELSWGIALPADYNETPLPCMQIRDNIIGRLQNASQQNQPFFIAAGFEKPHLPFLAPREFYELYPEGDIYLPANPYVPEHLPEVAWSSWNDLYSFKDILEFDNSYNNTLPDYKTLELRRGYYASISYTDSLIGEVLEELSSLGLSDDTIVVLMSDHGYQLGEHADWAKMTNFELDTHVAMMIKVPGLTDQGGVTEALVENVDVFPTIAELAGLEPLITCPPDSSQIKVCTEGHSMVELLSDPEKEWKSATFSMISRNANRGYLIHTPEFAYVRWMRARNGTIDWDDLVAEELYDLVDDPNQLINVAGFPEFETEQKDLLDQLLAGWRAALPQRNKISKHVKK